MGEYLKIPEVARRLDISEKTARRYIRSGELPSAFIGGAYRVSEEDLASYKKGAIVNPEELTTRPKAPSPLPLSPEPGEAERRISWMAGVLERVLDTWERQVREKQNHYQSRTIAVAALDVQDTVTFNYKPEWDALPSEEKTQRHALAKRIDQLVLDAFDHYKQAKKAETEEIEAIQRRREAIRRRTREISA